MLKGVFKTACILCISLYNTYFVYVHNIECVIKCYTTFCLNCAIPNLSSILNLCVMKIRENFNFCILYVRTQSGSAIIPCKPCQNCPNRAKNVHLTLFTMGEIFIIFSIFSDICYFLQIYEK